jgi:[acyl-carrier-protein] S-malonyltransferase
MVTFLFPGQGSQSAGMGKALADASEAARKTFEEADDALSMKLSTLCFEGPEEELKRTEITQPAILTTSVAALRALSEKRPDLKPSFVAGHSLGEWSALVAVGALRFTDAVKLVHTRGKLMQQAVPQGEGAMAAVIGLEPEKIVAICNRVREATGKVVAAANFNSPEQTVISGEANAVKAASDECQSAGASRVMPLPVSAPFHSPLMKPAADGLAQALAPVELGELSAPVITNVEAAPNLDRGRVKQLLIDQVTAPVRWVEIVQVLAAKGETSAVEIGPGKVLMGLARRIERKLKVHSVQDPESLEKTLAEL